MKTQVQNKNTQKKNSSRPLTIFVCIFMSALLLFGGILLTITLVRQSSYVVKYNGSGMDLKTATYFASYYKYRYIGQLRSEGVSVYDAPGFWEKAPEGDDKTYGEYLAEGALEYLKQTLAAAALFDEYAKLSAADKEKIEASVNYKLTNALGMDGTVKTFDENTAEYGFDYKTVKKAAEIFYKASRATSLIGDALLAEYPEGYDDYLAKYSHVRLMFVNGTHRIDENGNHIPMTDEQKAQMEIDLDAFRAHIAAGTASPDTFDYYSKKYNSFLGANDAGEYYLEKNSYFTKTTMQESFPEVVSYVLSTELKGAEVFGEVSYSGGTCFIYKYAPTAEAYNDKDMSIFFSDFESNASYYLYNKILLLYAEDATDTDKFASLNIPSLTYFYDYFITDF